MACHDVVRQVSIVGQVVEVIDQGETVGHYVKGSTGMLYRDVCRMQLGRAWSWGKHRWDPLGDSPPAAIEVLYSRCS